MRINKYLFILLVVEALSIPLFLTTILLIISGYGIINPRVVNLLTFGLMNYATSANLHTTEILRISFTILVLIHSYGGLILLSLRRIRNKLLKNIVSLLSSIITLYVFIILILSELLI